MSEISDVLIANIVFDGNRAHSALKLANQINEALQKNGINIEVLLFDIPASTNHYKEHSIGFPRLVDPSDHQDFVNFFQF